MLRCSLDERVKFLDLLSAVQRHVQFQNEAWMTCSLKSRIGRVAFEGDVG